MISTPSLAVDWGEDLSGSWSGTQVYPGRITLFQAQEATLDFSYYPVTQLGWGELAAGGLDIYEIPGSHLSMVQEPHVQVLAEKLSACLVINSVSEVSVEKPGFCTNKG